MQNGRPSCRTNLREVPGIWLGRRGIEPICQRRGCSHSNKVDVGLVSFSLSGVRNDLAFGGEFAASRRLVTAYFDRGYGLDRS